MLDKARLNTTYSMPFTDIVEAGDIE